MLTKISSATLYLFFCLGILLNASFALAQMEQMIRPANSSENLIHVSIPANIASGEIGLNAAFNLGGEASMAVEFLHAPEVEEYSKKQMRENGSSMVAGGQEIGLHVSRHTNGYNMSGFYYSLGAGHRQTHVQWTRPADWQFSLANEDTVNSDTNVNHRLTGTGLAAHGRLGYRYAATQWPLLAGAYFGLRHFESKFVDRKADGTSPTTVAERDELKRRFMTRPELCFEIGMSL